MPESIVLSQFSDICSHCGAEIIPDYDPDSVLDWAADGDHGCMFGVEHHPSSDIGITLTTMARILFRSTAHSAGYQMSGLIDQLSREVL